jgi:ABC-2 type transport system permease protein
MVTGWFFFSTFFLHNQASLRNFFSLLPMVFSFIIPAVTMRQMSEEYHIGSYETLMTLPVTAWDVITGKFMAATLFVGMMLLPTLFYPLTVSLLGSLDWGPVVGGYFGALLLGATFAAVGLFASTLTRNQIIAFIIGVVICFFLALIDKMLFFMPQTLLGLFQYLGADVHFQNISKGVVDTRDLIYFISVSIVALTGARLVMEKTQ